MPSKSEGYMLSNRNHISRGHGPYMTVHYSVSKYSATYNRDANVPKAPRRFFGGMRIGGEGNQRG